MALLLKNATFINWETLEFTETNILVSDNEDAPLIFLKSDKDISLKGDEEIIDCSRKYVTKSFAVGHHHVYSALARGMPAPAQKPQNFTEILKFIWWNLDKALDENSIKASALATAMACAKSGATFAIDHHASPGLVKWSLETIAEAFEKVGIGHLLCYEITDRDGRDVARAGLIQSESYLLQRQGLVGLHASFTVGDETMKKAQTLAERYKSGIHIHVAEDLYDQEHCLVNHHKRVIPRLADYGFLDMPKTILVHCLHLEEREREVLKNSKAWVAQNMESNLKNKVGVFNGHGLAPERIMLGTDGMHSDMLQSAKAAFFAGQKTDNIDFSAAYQRFRNVHRYLSSNGFKGDGHNNLVVLDYDAPTPFNQDNFLGHFLFGLRSNHVQHVISQGKLIVKNRILQTVDEEEILHFTRGQAASLWERMREQESLDI